MIRSDKFFHAMAAAAKQLGIKYLVVAVQDPETRAVRVVKSDGAVEVLKGEIARVCALTNPADAATEVGWGDGG